MLSTHARDTQRLEEGKAIQGEYSLLCPRAYTLGAMKGEPMAKPEHMLTPREAAAATGVSYAAIKKWILAGKLKTVLTPGGHHRIPESALAPLSTASQNAKPEKGRIESRERF